VIVLFSLVSNKLRDIILKNISIPAS